jgi:hypothetical protein
MRLNPAPALLPTAHESVRWSVVVGCGAFTDRQTDNEADDESQCGPKGASDGREDDEAGHGCTGAGGSGIQ